MKKQIKAAILGASVLALTATAAQAATYEITLAGASAQYDYWKATAPDFLQNDYPACATVKTFTQKKASGSWNPNADQGLAYGTGCAVNGGTNDTIIFRYASIASYTGVQLPLDLTKESGCANGEWKVIDHNSCFDNNDAATGTWNASCDVLVCEPVNLGASDVAGEAFTQGSSGYKTGPVWAAGTSPVTKTVTSSQIYVDTTAYPELKNRRPIVVPFSFFVTEDIKNMPTASTDLGTMKNLTHLQALLLMSGQVTNWEDVNIDANNDPATDTRVTVCYRHAGSGTHSTLDHVILHGDASFIYTAQNIGSSGPKIWFNDGSTDMMNCLSYKKTTSTVYPISTQYAIGYSDSDKCGDGWYGLPTGTTDANGDGVVNCSDLDNPATVDVDESLGCANDWSSVCKGVQRVAYQGVDASRESIANCEYPYWAAQWIYYNTNDVDADDADGLSPNTGLSVLMDKLLDYASDGAKLTATGSVRAKYWATQNEMSCKKNYDWTYPVPK